MQNAKEPRRAGLLTHAQVEAAEPREKVYRLSDGQSLYVVVRTSGSKSFEFRYKAGGRVNAVVLGPFGRGKDELGLAAARVERDKVRAKLREGFDPRLTRQINSHAQRQKAEEAKQARKQARADQQAASLTVERAASEWIAATRHIWTETHGLQVEQSLRDHVHPVIGARRMDSVTPGDLLSLLGAMIEEGKLETAQRIRQRLDAVFEWSALHHPEVVRSNPVALTKRAFSARLRQARKSQPKESMPCIPVAELPGLLRAMSAYTGPAGKLLRFVALTAARVGEARYATWREVDFDGAVWTVPPGRMKARREHRVPLSDQAVALLRDIQADQRPGTKLLFPHFQGDGRPMSENAALFALAAMGYKGRMSAHGWRSLFSTLSNESGRWSRDAIELSLAHVDPDKTRSAYNKSQMWTERVALMQWWSGELDRMERGTPAKVVKLRK